MYKPTKPVIVIGAGLVLTPLVVTVVQDPGNTKVDLPPALAFGVVSSTADTGTSMPFDTILEEVRALPPMPSVTIKQG
jgi:hypothetical protein